MLIDADLRRPTIADAFALSSGVGLTSVLLGDLATDEALQAWRDDLPLQVLTAGPIPPNPAELIGSARMASLIGELTERGATVVLDSPPLLPVTDAALLARATDGALVVARAASTHVDQLAAGCEALRIAGAPVLGVVLNRVPRQRGASYYGGYAYDSYRSHRSKQADEGQPEVPTRTAVTMPEPTGQPVLVTTPQAAAQDLAEPALGEPSVDELFPGIPPVHEVTEPVAGQLAPPAVPLSRATPVQAPPVQTPQAEESPHTRVVLPSSELPEAVRRAIAATGPARDGVPHRDQEPAEQRRPHASPRPSPRRAAQPADPDLVVDAENATFTRFEPSDEAPWHVEWGDLSALTDVPRNGPGKVNGEANGHNGARARHRN